MKRISLDQMKNMSIDNLIELYRDGYRLEEHTSIASLSTKKIFNIPADTQPIVNSSISTSTSTIAALQLENTAWPKFHRDLKNTGQSPYTSDADGTIKWYINFPDGIRGTPAIDIDGTIYVGMNSGLYAINPDGTIKWSYPAAGSEYSSPVISQDGIIYNFDGGGNLYAFNRNGTLVSPGWPFIIGMSGESGPAIGSDGNIYIGGNTYNDPWPGIFIAISPNGNEIWRYTTNDHGTPPTPVGGSAENYSPAISPTDGTIYIKIREDPYTYLMAFTQNGAEKWRVQIGDTYWWSRAICPAIGPDGTIYIPGGDNISAYLYAITDNGSSATVKWQYTLCTGDWIYTEDTPAIATDGTIYIAATCTIASIDYNNKYAITDNGTYATLKWSFPSNTELRSPAMIGLDGTIYFGSNRDITGLARFYSLNPNNGSIKWYKDIATNNSIVCSPSMAPDGTIYIGTDGKYGDPNGQSLVAFQSRLLDPVVNFGKVTVSTGYDAAATSIILNTNEGSKLPDPYVNGAFNLIWWNSTDYPDPSDDDTNKEIIRCIAKTTDTLIVIRAQEGTSASIKNLAGKTYKMILSPTAKMISDISSAIISRVGNHASLTTAHGSYGKVLGSITADARYAPIANGVTGGNLHSHSIGDGAQISHTTLSNIGINSHDQIDTAITDSINHIVAAAPHSGHESMTNKNAVNGYAGLSSNQQSITSFPIVSKAVSYVATPSDYTIVCTAPITITIPSAVGKAGKVYNIKSNVADTVAITSVSLIDAATTYYMYTLYETVTIQSDDTQWWII